MNLVDELRKAAEQIAKEGRKTAKYGADRWCDACIAHDALQRSK